MENHQKSFLKKIYDPEVTSVDGKECWFSNIKFLLIICVVLGHFFQTVTDKSDIALTLRTFIYMFHMPAFIFITGYFSKKCARDIVKNTNKILSIGCLYLIFQCLWYLNRKVSSGASFDKDFSVLIPDMGLWYLLFVVVATFILPFISRFKPYHILPIILLCGLLIGMENSVGKYLSVSRILVFMVYFAAGYFTDRKLLERLKNKKAQIFSALFFIYLLIFTYYFRDNIYIDILYGAESYSHIGFTDTVGIMWRSIFYLISIYSIYALFSLVPRGKFFFTKMGGNTLQIYLLHIYLYVALNNTGCLDLIITHCGGVWAIIILSVAITFILGLNFFSYPFRLLGRIRFNKYEEPEFLEQ